MSSMRAECDCVIFYIILTFIFKVKFTVSAKFKNCPKLTVTQAATKEKLSVIKTLTD